MTRAILTATINSNDPAEGRIRIRCVRNPDGSLDWIGPDGSADLTTHSKADAKAAALASWGAPEWDLRASWIEPAR